MSVFETFYLMFKSNAKDAIKGNEAVEKSARKTQDSIKETAEETKKLGDAYVKVLETGMQAAASVISFGAIKSGIMNSAKLTDQLGLQAKVTGQAADELLAYRNAVELAGGAAESLDQFVSSTVAYFDAMGAKAPSVEEMFRRMHKGVEGLNDETKRFRLRESGVPEDMLPMFMGTREELEEYIRQGKINAELTLEMIAASRAFNQELDKTGQGFDQLWMKMNVNVLPVLTEAIKGFNDLSGSLFKSEKAALGFFGILTSIATIIGAGAMAKFLGLGGSVMTGGILGYLTKVATVATTVVSRLGAVGAIISAGILIPEMGKAAGKSIAHAYNRYKGRGDSNGILPGKEGYTGDEKLFTPIPITSQPTSGRFNKKAHIESGMRFWMSQGYTRAQAAGIMANEWHESSDKTSFARGDGGQAHGLYQWHPDRRAKILKGTGIDVSSASVEDQRRAAAWEMKNEAIFKDTEFRNINDANAAASYFSRKFERPRDVWGEAFKRGETASGFYSQYGGGSSSNVTIGEVNVNTQATDAAGIASEISSELNKQIGYTRGVVDNGVQY